MKQNFTRFRSASVKAMVLAAILSAAGAHAQQSMNLSHGVSFKDPVYPYTGFCVNEDVNGLSIAMKFTADELTNFVGSKVKAIHVGWSGWYQGSTPESTAFIRTSLNGSDLATATCTLDSDWGDFTFDTPYEIKAGEELVLGYTVDLPANVFGPCTTMYGNAKTGQYYISRPDELDGEGNRLWNDVSELGSDMSYPIMIYADVEISGDELNDLASIEKAFFPSILYKGEDATGIIRLVNNGVNKINSVELTYTERSGEKKTYSFNISQTLEPNSKLWMSVPVLGTPEGVLRISGVNGNVNKDADKNRIQFSALCLDHETADKYVRRPVVEYFCSESDYSSAKYLDEIIIPGFEQYADDLTKIYWHFDDQFQLGLADEKDDVLDMLVDICDGNKMQIRIPDMSLDRDVNLGLPANYLDILSSYCLGIVYPQAAVTMYDYAFSMPTFAGLEVKAERTDDEIRISVDGNVAPGVLPMGEDLFLTVVALEDGIHTDSQEFPDDGDGEMVREYVHNNLVRERLTDRWGDKISCDTEGNFHSEYTLPVSDEYVVGNMHVAALINRNALNPNNKRNVINSAECKVTDMSGVGSVASEGNFTVTDGSILCGSTPVEVYDLTGKRVENSRLAKGLYIVRAEGARGVKVVVK